MTLKHLRSLVYIVVGIAHFVFRRQFTAISEDHAGAEARGMNVRLWDFLFYVLFGLVVTSFVHIGGVLLVFSYLVIPAVCATFLVKSFGGRFLVGRGGRDRLQHRFLGVRRVAAAVGESA